MYTILWFIARKSHHAYLRRYANTPKRALFLGMNPGPWGMAQTGVPFGEVAAVRDWLGIKCLVDRPKNEHPLRSVLGFDCPRSEVSGRRLWGFFAKRFGTAGEFFADNIVLNYCPLLFLHTDSKRCVNLTPDKLSATDKEPLYAACDSYLRVAVECFRRIFLSVSALPRGDSINYSAMINRLSAKFYIPARLARRLIGALKKRRPNNCKHSAFLRIKIQYGGELYN